MKVISLFTNISQRHDSSPQQNMSTQETQYLLLKEPLVRKRPYETQYFLLKEPLVHKTSIETTTPRRTLRGVGLYGVWALSSGTMCILGSFAFISFLWWNDSTNEVWRKIMVTGWATRSITLAALVVRISVSAQAIVCTGMLAALALGRHQVPLASSASVSLLQFANSGPFSLIQPLLRSYRRFTSVPSMGLIVLALGIFMTLTNVTSTALLSDLDTGRVPGDEERITVYFQKNVTWWREVWAEQRVWTRQPDQFPCFAEMPSLKRPLSMKGIHDTGLQLRAFLPMLSSEVRANVKDFSGIASLMGMRTVCAKPGLDLTITPLHPTTPSGYNLSGLAWLDLDQASLVQIAPDINKEYLRPAKNGSRFECIAPDSSDPNYRSKRDWKVSFCNNTGLPLFDDGKLFSWFPFISHNQSSEYYVINVTHSSALTPAPDSEWATQRMNDSEIVFSISACKSVYIDRYMYITASRKANVTEPTLQWDRSASTYETHTIRRQLDVTNENITFEQRGIMRLKSYTTLNTTTHRDSPDVLDLFVSATAATWGSPSVPLQHNSAGDALDNSLSVCHNCVFLGDNDLGGVHAAILNDILRETAHPALALQAYAMILYGMSYYAHLIEFDIPDNGTIRYFVAALLPVSTRGYWAVTAILSLHLVLVMVVVVLYFRSSARGIILRGAWSTVAQLQTEEFKWVWDAARGRTDKEVEKMFEQKGLKSRYAWMMRDGVGHVIGSKESSP